MSHIDEISVFSFAEHIVLKRQQLVPEVREEVLGQRPAMLITTRIYCIILLQALK